MALDRAQARKRVGAVNRPVTGSLREQDLEESREPNRQVGEIRLVEQDASEYRDRLIA